MPPTRRDRRGETEQPVVTGSKPQPITSRPASGTGTPKATRPPRGAGTLVTMRAIDDLTDKDVLETPFHFQCPPLDTFAVSYSYGYNTYQTLRHGEMITPSGRALAVVSFRTLFLSYNASWTFDVDRPNPLSATRALRRILHSGTPFALYVHNNDLWGRKDVHWSPKNGNAAVLTSLDVEEAAGEPDTRYVNVSFQEYREPKLVRRRKGKRQSESRGRKLPAVILVTDKTGDWKRTDPGHPRSGKNASLRDLAKHFYGEQSQWRIIAAHPKNGRLKKLAPGESIGKAMKGKEPLKIVIPKPPIASINRPGKNAVEED